MDRIVIDVSKPRRGRLSSPSRLREWLTALIGEARARARRRRRRIAAGLFVAALVVLSVGLGGIFNHGGGGTTPEPTVNFRTGNGSVRAGRKRAADAACEPSR